jgi:histidinol dehydrogenase
MKVIRKPEREEWPAILRRPGQDMSDIEPAVRSILERVKREGDAAVRELTHELDQADIASPLVTPEEIELASARVPEGLREAIDIAASNIRRFHEAQVEETRIIETMPGVRCWRKSVAIERVGLYVPGGSAPLFSTVLMLAIPARIAGCRDVVLCTPPNARGDVDDAVLYAARLCGVSRVLKIGGAQAIAAMAYGTETVPRVDKIFGPGNRFVTLAKQIVSAEVAIDLPAGPSELAVLADDACEPSFVAADLLSQAEHGPDSQVIFVTDDEATLQRVVDQVALQLRDLPRQTIAVEALRSSRAIVVRDIREGVDLINEYAPEHLILAVRNADEIADAIVNAGSVFIGSYTPESVGDYASGTNHTLPTAGFARSMSGVSLDSFVKKITFQKVDAEGLRLLGPHVECMAKAELLDAHARAISIRMEALNERANR